MKRTVCVAAAVAMLTCATAAEAVTNIRYERWLIFQRNLAHDAQAPPDTTSRIQFSFDATVTAADLDPAHGFRFALAERDAATRDVLVRFELETSTELPAVGSDIYISIECELYCDAGGKLQMGDTVLWSATWCNFPNQRSSHGEGGDIAFPASSDAEDFELVLLDENDQDGTFPTPEDGLSCSDGIPSGPELAVVAPEFADSGSIGLYADQSGLLCSGQVTPNVPFRWYVVLHQEGMTLCGIGVVEFGIRGLPDGFFYSSTPNPAAFLQSGDPFSRAILGFNCKQGDTETIVLYTVDGIVIAPVQNDIELTMESGNPPTNRYWPYPWIELCPGIYDYPRRMRGTSFVINPSPGHPCDTTVSAESATWGAVKSLYRGER